MTDKPPLDPKEINDLLDSYSPRNDFVNRESEQKTATYPYRRPSTVLGNPYSSLPKPVPFSSQEDASPFQSRQQPLRIHNPLNGTANSNRPQPGVRPTHRTLSLPVQNNLEGFDNLVNGNYSDRQSYQASSVRAPGRNDFGFNGELAEKAQRAYDWLSGSHRTADTARNFGDTQRSSTLQVQTNPALFGRNTPGFGHPSKAVDISALDSALHSPGRGTEVPASSTNGGLSGFYTNGEDDFDDMAKTTPNWRNSFSAVRDRFGNEAGRQESPAPNFSTSGSMTMPRPKQNGSPAPTIIKSASQGTFDRQKPRYLIGIC